LGTPDCLTGCTGRPVGLSRLPGRAVPGLVEQIVARTAHQSDCKPRRVLGVRPFDAVTDQPLGAGFSANASRQRPTNPVRNKFSGKYSHRILAGVSPPAGEWRYWPTRGERSRRAILFSRRAEKFALQCRWCRRRCPCPPRTGPPMRDCMRRRRSGCSAAG
jgi:hypothetical protein